MATLHPSLLRRALVGDGQKLPMFVLYTFVAILLMAFPWTKVTLITAGVMVLCVHGALIWIAYYDPDFWKVLADHWQNQNTYQAARRSGSSLFDVLLARKEQSFPDTLPYDTMPDELTMVTKDLGLMGFLLYTGPDLETASQEDLDLLARHLNTAFVQLGGSSALHIDLFRHPSMAYPTEGAFPDPVSRLIDDERRRQYEASGQHFESTTIMTVTWTPPKNITRRLQALFKRHARTTTGMEENRQFFSYALNSFIQLLKRRLTVHRLSGSDITTYLHRCITGCSHEVRVPNPATYMDVWLGSQDLLGGFDPMVGEQHVRVVALTGFPSESKAALLAFLGNLPCAYRVNHRFLFLDAPEAGKLIRKARHTWDVNLYGIVDRIVAGLTGDPPKHENIDAKEMLADAKVAEAELTQGQVKFGYLTSCIVLYHNDIQEIEDLAQLVVSELTTKGFPSRVEKLNAVSAYCGSLPGNTRDNKRLPLMHSLNLAELVPTTTIWPGYTIHPSNQFPPNSPPTMIVGTTGQTPFRYTPWVGDVGHRITVGRVGSGKTTHTNVEIMQTLRYPGARVFCITQRYGSELVTAACGGLHMDLATDQSFAFAPLAHIDEEAQRMKAGKFIEACLALQQVDVGLPQHEAILHTLELMVAMEDRTMTNFWLTVQDEAVRAGIFHYTRRAPLGWLFDAPGDLAVDTPIVTFDLTELKAAGDEYFVPGLLCIMQLIERTADTGHHTYVPIDEGWVALLHPQFADIFCETLRTARHKNIALNLITQSLSDFNASSQKALILEQCPTRIILPDPLATSPEIAPLYAGINLGAQAREVIASMVPKHDYLFSSEVGSRPYHLDLGPAALALCCRGGDENRRAWHRMRAANPESWLADWFRYCGAAYTAAVLEREHQQEVA